MAHKRKLSYLEKNVYSQLVPIFGNLGEEIITLSLLDKSNNYEPLTEDLLLQRCLDDLLALRTFTESTIENNNNKEKNAAKSYSCSTSSPATERDLLDSDFDSPDVVVLHQKTSKSEPIVIEDSPATPMTLTSASNDFLLSPDRQPEASTSKKPDKDTSDLSFSLERGGVYKVKTKLKYASPLARVRSDSEEAHSNKTDRSSPLSIDISDTSSKVGSWNDKSNEKGDSSLPSYLEISDSEMLELASLVESPGASVSPKSTAEESAVFSLTPPRLNLGKKDYLFTPPKSGHRVASATVTSSKTPAKFSLNSFLDKQRSSIDKKSELPQATLGSGPSKSIGAFEFENLDRSNGTNTSRNQESSTKKDMPEKSGVSAAAQSMLNPPAKSGFSFGNYDSPSIYKTLDSSSQKSSTSATSSSSPIRPGHFRSASVGSASSSSSWNGAPKLDRSHSLLESPETKGFDEWLKEQERAELWFERRTPQKDNTPVPGKKGEAAPSGQKNVSMPVLNRFRTPITEHSSANSTEQLFDTSASSLDISDINELPDVGQSHDVSPASKAAPAVNHRHLSGISGSSVSNSDTSVHNSSTDLTNSSVDISVEELDGDNLPVLDVRRRARDKFKVPPSAGSQPPNRSNQTNTSSRGAAGNTELYSLTLVNRQKDYDEMRDLYHEYKKVKKSNKKFHDAHAIQLLAVAKRKYKKARVNFLLKYDEKVELGMNKADAALHSAEKRQSLVAKMKKNSDVGKAVQTGAKSRVVQQVAANIASAKIAGPKVTTAANLGQGVTSTAQQQPGQNTGVNTSQSNRVEQVTKSAAVGKNSDSGKTASGSGDSFASKGATSMKTSEKSTTQSKTTEVPPYRAFSFGRDTSTNGSSATTNMPQNNSAVGGNAGSVTATNVSDLPYRAFSFGRDARTINASATGSAAPGTSAKTQENNIAFGGNATGTGASLVGGPLTAGYAFAGQAAPGATAKVQQKNTSVGVGRNVANSAGFAFGGIAPKQKNTGFAFGQAQGTGSNTGSGFGCTANTGLPFGRTANNTDLPFGQGTANSTGFPFGQGAGNSTGFPFGQGTGNNTGFAFGQGTSKDTAWNEAYDYGVAMNLNALFGPGRAVNVAIGKGGRQKNVTVTNPRPPDVGGANSNPPTPTQANTNKLVGADDAKPKLQERKDVPFVQDNGGVNAKPPKVGGVNDYPTPAAATTDKPVGAEGDRVRPKDDPPQVPDILGHPQVEVLDDEQIVKNFNEKTAKGLLEIFPKADKNFILRKLLEGNNENAIATILLEMPPEARAKEEKPAAASASGSKEAETEELPDYLNTADLSVRPAYGYTAFDVLKNQYLRVSVQDLQKITNFYGNHYSHAKKCLDDNLMAANVLEEAKRQKKNVSPQERPPSPIKMCLKKVNGPEAEWTVRLLKHGRQMRPVAASGVHPELQREIQYMKNQEKKESEKKDEKLANEINEKEYEDTDQLIECGCCYGEVAFERMIQCYEGHLFCRECLQRYAQEAVFGQGKMSLSCMTDGCSASFPRSQLESTLSDKILHQYDDRCQEEAINLAGIDNLVGCPFCEFKAVLDIEDKVFVCPNEKCGKSSCRHCGLDWEEHFGKRCDELEKKDETKLRTSFEEKMTQAKIRTCHACKASFMKSDGCNKMTCRCTATMCYICRKANIDYNHFCRHPRSPKKDCKICSVCSLWSNPEEDDERALQEVKKEANKARKDLGFDDEKLIGAPDEPAAKKAKYAPTVAVAAQGQARAPNQNRPQPPRPGNPVPFGALIEVPRQLHGQLRAGVHVQPDMHVGGAQRLPMLFQPPPPVHGWPMNNLQPPQRFRNVQHDPNADFFQNDDVPQYNYQNF